MDNTLQALNFLYTIAELAPVPKAQHAQCQDAYKILTEALKPKEEIKNPENV